VEGVHLPPVTEEDRSGYRPKKAFCQVFNAFLLDEILGTLGDQSSKQRVLLHECLLAGMRSLGAKSIQDAAELTEYLAEPEDLEKVHAQHEVDTFGAIPDEGLPRAVLERFPCVLFDVDIVVVEHHSTEVVASFGECQSPAQAIRNQDKGNACIM